MSIIHVNQIRAKLDELFTEHIDISDLADRPERDRTQAFRSRALAAFSITALSGVEPRITGPSVTDAYDDNGIDLVFYEPNQRVLYLAQSKWSERGTGTISRGDIGKFLKGVEDIVSMRFGRFNDKINAMSETIESALNGSNTRVHLVITYSGEQPLSDVVDRDVRDLVEDYNDPTPLVQYTVMRQQQLHAAIVRGLEGDPIDLEIGLHNWGRVDSPYQAYYGAVAAEEVAKWWREYNPQIFSPNIRVFLDNSAVNEGIINTLGTEPDHLWYFNNGITALCQSASRKVIGGSSRDMGVFECQEFSIINGAQTVGAIAQHEQAGGSLEGARVQVRIIILEQTPSDFWKHITRYNNTQNRIDRRDFVALDSNQERLRQELKVDNVCYVFRNGEHLEPDEEGFDLTSATVARACLLPDIAWTAVSRKEIGRLWSNIESEPYRLLFNNGVSGPSLWKTVQAFRAVDEGLRSFRKRDGRERSLATHGNRFIAHMMFQPIRAVIEDGSTPLEEGTSRALTQGAQPLFERIASILDKDYPGAYIAHFFRNQEKCENLKNKLLSPPSPHEP